MWPEKTPEHLLRYGNKFQIFYFVLRGWIEQIIELYAEIIRNETFYGI